LAMTNLTTKTEDSYVLNPRVVYEKHWMMTRCCLTNEYGLTCQVRSSQHAAVLQPLMLYDSLRNHIRMLLLERNDNMFQHSLPIVNLWRLCKQPVISTTQFISSFITQRRTLMRETEQ
jgi:hypothetical protein